MLATSRHHHARVFWALQLGGWTAYAIALMVPWLGRFPISVMWSNKLVIAATGLVTSSVLRLVYRRVAHEGVGLSPLCVMAVSYTHLRAHETPEHLVCRLLLEKKKKD